MNWESLFIPNWISGKKHPTKYRPNNPKLYDYEMLHKVLLANANKLEIALEAILSAQPFWSMSNGQHNLEVQR